MAISRLKSRSLTKYCSSKATPEAGRSRVDLLQSGEFVRVWVNHGGTHYLLHLPVRSGA